MMELAGLPTGVAARWVALEALREAEAARARLAEPGALHDFHAALRRLRSTLRAYRELLDVRPRDRRALRRLVRAAGEARDAAAQIDLLQRLSDAGAAEALERVRARAAEAAASLRAEADQFATRAGKLEKRLRRYVIRLKPADAPGGILFRTALAERLRIGADALEAELAELDGEARDDAARRVWSAAERLRHLAQPLELRGARRVLGELDGIMEPLGRMRDAHLLAVEASLAEGEGAEALQRHFAKERDEHFAAFRERRKYLLNAMPSLAGLEVVEHRLDQGYIPGDRLAERVRRIRTADGTRWVRTVKLGTGVSRIEVEEDTTERIFRALWRLTRGHRVRKRRYSVRVGDRVWEIDRFRDRRLVLAEVELPTEDAVVEIPEWLRPVLVREVTGDPAYVNLNLAR
jgi:CYTH domain-containing protein